MFWKYVANWQENNFIEITLWHRCSPVNLLHIFSRLFLKNTSRQLLLRFINFMVLWNQICYQVVVWIPFRQLKLPIFFFEGLQFFLTHRNVVWKKTELFSWFKICCLEKLVISKRTSYEWIISNYENLAYPLQQRFCQVWLKVMTFQQYLSRTILWINRLRNYLENHKNTQQTSTCSESIMETLENWKKYVKSQH